jgi:predicted short-subunit dehydrogenase-like oxidoreductase (DUF2520 family)
VRIAIVGAGRAGTAVAAAWVRAGHVIVGVSGRDATRTRAAAHLPDVPIGEPGEVVPDAELVVLGVPDDRIEETAGQVARGLAPGAWIAHLSGAVGLDALDPSGGRRLAIHPLQTFPDVERALVRLGGCTVAVTADDDEGYALGERLGRDLGGRPFRLAPERRALYHAAAVLGSNDVVALSSLALEALAEAGVPDPTVALAPLQAATVENVALLGPGAALTGPAVRGDARTIEANLAALGAARPAAVAPYVVLCRTSLDLATAVGRLPPDRRAAVEEVLDRWS